MARDKNKLSVNQTDPNRFNIIKGAIESIGVENLAKRGTAKRSSLFKYKNRNPVNTSVEARILKAILEAGGSQENNLTTLADTVIAKHMKTH